MPEIYINNGSNLQNMTYDIMVAADIKSKISTNMTVCIKPNLVLASPAENGATTHPEIVEGIIMYLQEVGVNNITIAEGSWVGDSTIRAFKTCGFNELSDKYNVKLLDTKKDSVIKIKSGGLELDVCISILDVDYLINVPVLKGHCQTYMTCCMKNLKGCISDSEKRRYHTMGLHKPIALLNKIIKPDLHIIDNICGDLTFEEGGNPIYTGRVILGFDAVLLDSYCATLMGYHPDDIGYLKFAKQYNIGNYFGNDTEIIELNKDGKVVSVKSNSGVVKQLSRFIDEDSACSACYAALIHALDKSGFNPIEKIKIGQGYKNKKLNGVGVGNCTSGCGRYVKGCPPSALDIVNFFDTTKK